MERNNPSALKLNFERHINNLIAIYEKKSECGIFFKLNPDKSPLEILGVLDFLKDRIKKWGNLNLFTYQGKLFSNNYVLVVGSRNLEEAINIIIYMYLTTILENRYGIDSLMERLDSSNNLENFLKNHIADHIEKGYPANPELESELVSHLKKIMYKNSEDPIR